MILEPFEGVCKFHQKISQPIFPSYFESLCPKTKRSVITGGLTETSGVFCPLGSNAVLKKGRLNLVILVFLQEFGSYHGVVW